MEKVEVIINGIKREYEKGTTFLEISKDVENEYSNTIMLAKLGENLRELDKTLEEGGTLTFLTTATETGRKTYSRGIIMIFMKALYHVVGKSEIRKASIEFSHGPGYYGEVDMDRQLTQELLDEVAEYMRELIRRDLPFEKFTIDTREAIKKFHEYKMFAKEKLFRYRRVSKTNVYNLDGFEDYFYGYMPYSTGYLRHFQLFCYDDGFVLQIPTKNNPKYVPKFEPKEKLFQVLKEVTVWNRSMEIDTVGALNDVIAGGDMGDLILVQEALQEKKIAEIAEQIAERRDRKFVMIAGPSSSGKTTFSHRLSIQLRTYGLRPHPIGLDDYFKNREDTPLNEDGTYNFECLEAIDVKQFNADMMRLLEGERRELPTFNFKTGRREYKGNYLSMGPEDILVIEGIHGLNDRLSYSLPKDSKFRIYISALSALNIDEHNQISTSDGRLIRRMVRDARSRGTKAAGTIEMWKSVRAGEEKYIFPFQESADAMFNSALNYELSVLKPFAEPILFGIGEDEPAYMEAKRMLKFLDYFVGVSSEDVPKNSILREFIGNSYFNV